METHKVKITVLKRMDPKDVFEKIPVTPAESLGVCDVFEDGQVFISEPYGRMPEGFPCGSAWSTIYER